MGLTSLWALAPHRWKDLPQTTVSDVHEAILTNRRFRVPTSSAVAPGTRELGPCVTGLAVAYSHRVSWVVRLWWRSSRDVPMRSECTRDEKMNVLSCTLSLRPGCRYGQAIATVRWLLHQAAVKPHRWHHRSNSPDPDVGARIPDIVDVHVHAHDLNKRGQMVLSVDEKTNIQARECRCPRNPRKSARAERIEHEYIRHVTCCLTGSLEVAAGEIYGHVTKKHGAEGLAPFVESVCGACADVRKIYVVLDDLNTHWHELTSCAVAKFARYPLPPVKTGAQRRAFLTSTDKHVIFHVTPSDASWLRQIETRSRRLSARCSAVATSRPKQTWRTRSSNSSNTITSTGAIPLDGPTLENRCHGTNVQHNRGTYETRLSSVWI